MFIVQNFTSVSQIYWTLFVYLFQASLSCISLSPEKLELEKWEILVQVYLLYLLSMHKQM